MNSKRKKYIKSLNCKIAEFVADILCPKKCIVCNCMVNVGKSVSLCHFCAGIIKKQGRVYADDKVAYEEAVSALEYDGKIRDALIRYKFGGKKYLHKTFSLVLWQKINSREFLKNIDIICPVPIHPLRGRDYNQSMLIAADISAYSGIRVTEDLLVKIKNIKPLSTMSYADRRIFIKGSIDLNCRYDVFGKNILLVDDIFTTGATVAECARILKMNGAAEVYVVSVCYAMTEDVQEESDEGGTTNVYANLFDD